MRHQAEIFSGRPSTFSMAGKLTLKVAPCPGSLSTSSRCAVEAASTCSKRGPEVSVEYGARAACYAGTGVREWVSEWRYLLVLATVRGKMKGQA